VEPGLVLEPMAMRGEFLVARLEPEEASQGEVAKEAGVQEGPEGGREAVQAVAGQAVAGQVLVAPVAAEVDQVVGADPVVGLHAEGVGPPRFSLRPPIQSFL
jgi:hypothetical protein